MLLRDSDAQCWDSAEDSDPNDDCYGLLDYDTPMVIGKQSRKPARVLVCAPSNSALDEIVHRIIQRWSLWFSQHLIRWQFEFKREFVYSGPHSACLYN